MDVAALDHSFIRHRRLNKGRGLTELMIKYDLGVATESVIEIKRIDSDYFEES